MDWPEITRRLFHGRMRLRPWEIERMTVPELILALDDDLEKSRGPTGSVPLTPEYIAWWRSLTVEDRIAQARSQWA